MVKIFLSVRVVIKVRRGDFEVYLLTPPVAACCVKFTRRVATEGTPLRKVSQREWGKARGDKPIMSATWIFAGFSAGTLVALMDRERTVSRRDDETGKKHNNRDGGNLPV